MLIKEVNAKDESQLKEELNNHKKELFNLRFQQAGGQLTNPSRIKIVKKSIARIKTVINQRLSKSDHNIRVENA